MRLIVIFPVLALCGSILAQPSNLLTSIQTAEKSRNSIRAAELRLREAELNLGAATPFSPLRLEAGYGTFPTLGAGEDFLVALPVDVFGKNRAARGTASANLGTVRAQLRQAKLDLQSQVIDAYADLVSAQIQLRTGKQLQDIQQRSYDATKKRVDNGDLPPVELLRSDLDLQRTKTAALVNEQNLQAARQRLSAAIGGPVADLVDESLLAMPTTAKTARPDLQELQAGVNTAQADVRSADASRLPDFELQFRRNPWGEAEGYNFRGQIVWNLLDWGAGDKRARAARAAREAARKDLSDRLATAEKEIAAAEADMSAAQASVDSFAKLEEDALALLDKEQKGFDLGGNTLLGVLEATRSLREIQASEADAKLRLIQAQGKWLAAKGIVLTELP